MEPLTAGGAGSGSMVSACCTESGCERLTAVRAEITDCRDCISPTSIQWTNQFATQDWIELKTTYTLRMGLNTTQIIDI